MSPVRVLVIDDSATMRRVIGAALGRENDIEVVGEAADALQARDAIKRLDPDVLTLDVEMPQMSGLEFLEKLMRLRPTPVIMVSSYTERNADLALQAIALGAVDCAAKPRSGDVELFPDLADKIRAAAFVGRSGKWVGKHVAAVKSVEAYRDDGRIIAVGSSTGGIEALTCFLEGFPSDGPPVLITQHMPRNFTTSLAARLDRVCAAVVTEAVDGAALRRGAIYLAPGGSSHLRVVDSRGLRCRLTPGPPTCGHRPSVDVLFHSVAEAVGGSSVGVILSGMGNDGAAGLLAMRRTGARTFGQNEATCLVYGMPRVAHEIGAVEREIAIEKMRDAALMTPLFNNGLSSCR